MANNSQKTRRMVMAAILLGFIFLFAFTPVGFIKMPFAEITILMIPVAVGASVLGVGYGTLLGFFFGICSFLQAFTGSVFGAALFGINPITYFLVCVPTRTLMGFCTALLFRAVRRIDKTRFVSYIVGSVSGAVFNTVFFVSAFLLFFRNATLEAFSMDLSTMNLWEILAALVGINGLVEIAVCAVVGTALAKPLSRLVADGEKKRC